MGALTAGILRFGERDDFLDKILTLFFHGNCGIDTAGETVGVSLGVLIDGESMSHGELAPKFQRVIRILVDESNQFAKILFTYLVIEQLSKEVFEG